MLRLFIRPVGSRSFCNSRILKAAEKEKDVVKASETPANGDRGGVKMDFAPSELDKLVLVLSGRYKSKAEIPPRIAYATIDNARSRFRIRGANLMMVATLFLCGYYVWKGKKMAREGETINKMHTDMEKRIKADAANQKQSQI